MPMASSYNQQNVRSTGVNRMQKATIDVKIDIDRCKIACNSVASISVTVEGMGRQLRSENQELRQLLRRLEGRDLVGGSPQTDEVRDPPGLEVPNFSYSHKRDREERAEELFLPDLQVSAFMSMLISDELRATEICQQISTLAGQSRQRVLAVPAAESVPPPRFLGQIRWAF